MNVIGKHSRVKSSYATLHLSSYQNVEMIFNRPLMCKMFDEDLIRAPPYAQY